MIRLVYEGGEFKWGWPPFKKWRENRREKRVSLLCFDAFEFAVRPPRPRFLLGGFRGFWDSVLASNSVPKIVAPFKEPLEPKMAFHWQRSSVLFCIPGEPIFIKRIPEFKSLLVYRLTAACRCRSCSSPQISTNHSRLLRLLAISRCVSFYGWKSGTLCVVLNSRLETRDGCGSAVCGSVSRRHVREPSHEIDRTTSRAGSVLSANLIPLYRRVRPTSAER